MLQKFLIQISNSVLFVILLQKPKSESLGNVIIKKAKLKYEERIQECFLNLKTFHKKIEKSLLQCNYIIPDIHSLEESSSDSRRLFQLKTLKYGSLIEPKRQSTNKPQSSDERKKESNMHPTDQQRFVVEKLCHHVVSVKTEACSRKENMPDGSSIVNDPTETSPERKNVVTKEIREVPVPGKVESVFDTAVSHSGKVIPATIKLAGTKRPFPEENCNDFSEKSAKRLKKMEGHFSEKTLSKYCAKSAHECPKKRKFCCVASSANEKGYHGSESNVAKKAKSEY